MADAVGVSGENRHHLDALFEDGETLFLEPRDKYDTCIIGVGFRFSDGPLAVYAIPRVLKVLQRTRGLTEEEAEEFFEFNIVGAWAGEGTPIFTRPLGPGLAV